MAYISPGAAFSGGLEAFVAQRDAQARQAMLDKITQDREARMQAQEQQQAAMHAAALTHQQQMDAQSAWEFGQKKDEAARNDFTRKYLVNAMPGDIIDAGTKALGAKLGIDVPTHDKQIAETPQGSDTVTLPGLDGQPSDATMAGSALPAQKLSIPVYDGDIKYRQAQAAQQAAHAQQQPILDSLRNGADPKIVAEQMFAAGYKPAEIKSMIESVKGPETQGVWQVGRDGKLTQMGSVPKGDQLRMEPAPVNVHVSGAPATFDQGAVDIAAKALAKGGKDALVSFAGQKGTDFKMAVLARAAKFNTATGQFTPDGEVNPNVPDLRDAMLGLTSDRSAASQLAKTYVMTEAFSDTARKNAMLLDSVMDNIPDSGIPMVNALTRGVAKQTGDANVAAFNVYRKSVADEYTAILSRATAGGSGGITDTARKDISELLSPNATKGQISAAINALATEAANRSDSYKAWHDRMTGGYGRLSDTTSPAPSTGKFKIISVEPIGK